MSYYQTLRAVIEPLIAQHPRLNPEVRSHYIGALITCYHSMVASEPLLKLAAAQRGPFQAYFTLHEAEERGHEKWMLKDITELGGVIGEPPPEIVTMCGEMYYRVKHINPACLLGYMAVIEGFPARPEVVLRVKELYPEGSYTLEYHATNDVDHHQDLKEQLDQVPEELQRMVMISAIRTAELYGQALWRMVFNGE